MFRGWGTAPQYPATDSVYGSEEEEDTASSVVPSRAAQPRGLPVRVPPHPYSTRLEPPTRDPLYAHPRFARLKNLSDGPAGMVQLALNRETREQVAIKFLLRGNTFNAASIVRELQNHRLCHLHPHIVPLREVFLTPRYLAIVTEYANGGDLAQYMSQLPQGQALPEDVARLFFQQIMVAVDYSHRMGVANRDIKLDNILLHRQDAAVIVKLCDFGFSKDEDRNSGSKSGCGTPEYVAPEVLTSELGYDGRLSDVWSAGVVLYILLTGCFPFLETAEEHDDPVTKMRAMFPRIVKGEFLPIQNSVSPEGRDLLRQLLEPNPARRIPLACVLAHPWFLRNLPPGYTQLNEALLAQSPKEANLPSAQSSRDLLVLVRACERYASDSDPASMAFAGLDLSVQGPHFVRREEKIPAHQQQY